MASSLSKSPLADEMPHFEYAPVRSGIHRTSRYELTEQIGEGTYGKVFKGRDLVTGRAVAMKRMLPHHEEEGFPRTETREIKILKSVAHPNMVKLLEVVTSLGTSEALTLASDKKRRSPPGVSATDAALALGQSSRTGDIYMVFEYVDYDFAGLLESGYRFSEGQIKSYVFQLLSVLDFLHSKGYAHRDLKCANLLLTDDNVLKLGDFGLARSLAVGEAMTNTVITLWYRPPELLLGAREYGSAVDMWSVGCILLELLSGKPPFPARTEMEQLKNIFNIMGTPPKSSELRNLPHWNQIDLEDKRPRLVEWLGRHPAVQHSPDVRDLLMRLLEAEPRKRVSAREALGARWFNAEPRIVKDNPTYVLVDEGGEAREGAATRGGAGGRRKIPPVSSNSAFQTDMDYHEFTARERRKERTRAAAQPDAAAAAAASSSSSSSSSAAAVAAGGIPAAAPASGSSSSSRFGPKAPSGTTASESAAAGASNSAASYATSSSSRPAPPFSSSSTGVAVTTSSHAHTRTMPDSLQAAAPSHAVYDSTHAAAAAATAAAESHTHRGQQQYIGDGGGGGDSHFVSQQHAYAPPLPPPQQQQQQWIGQQEQYSQMGYASASSQQQPSRSSGGAHHQQHYSYQQPPPQQQQHYAHETSYVEDGRNGSKRVRLANDSSLDNAALPPQQQQQQQQYYQQQQQQQQQQQHPGYFGYGHAH